MSWKMFGQIVLLMVIGVLIIIIAKCAVKSCPIMGKYMRPYPSSMTCIPAK